MEGMSSRATRRFGNCVEDACVARTAAEVSTQPFANLRQGRRGRVVQQLDRGHDHAGGADTALRPSAFEKRLLYGMKAALVRQPFDSAYRSALSLQHRNQAAVHQLAIHQHGAGTALPLAAAFLGAGKTNLCPQNVEQTLHGIDRHGVWGAIYGEGDVAPAHWLPSAASAVCRDSAARSGSAVMARKISSGSSGMELNSTPVACTTALMITGAGPSIGNSPIPLAP